jgi:tRNA-Thr(GGU) m(6)t(6)A37 methyltransferase TsaA
MNAELKQIGVVRSAVPDREAVPIFGAPAIVEIFPEYTDGLRHLEKHSHVWVIAWLHEADRDRLLVTPRGVTDKSEAGLHGVFAVRSPTRPNPLAMTVARIEKIEGARIHVDRLDFIDGTPVIDVKPYFRSRDAIYSSRNLQIGRPRSPDAMLESLVYQAENFHGERCGPLALGARIVAHLRSTYFDYAEIAGIVARVPKSSGCLMDVVMALTGATPGCATLQAHDSRSIVFESDQARYEYALHEPGWSRFTFEQGLVAPEPELFSASWYSDGVGARDGK